MWRFLCTPTRVNTTKREERLTPFLPFLLAAAGWQRPAANRRRRGGAAGTRPRWWRPAHRRRLPAVPHGAAVRRTARSKRPFFRWYSSPMAAVGRKYSRLMAMASACSTPRNSVISSNSSVPPPTPHADRIPVQKPASTGRSHAVTGDTGRRRTPERRRRDTAATGRVPGETVCRPQSRLPVHPADRAGPA